MVLMLRKTTASILGQTCTHLAYYLAWYDMERMHGMHRFGLVPGSTQVEYQVGGEEAILGTGFGFKGTGST